MIIIDMIVNCDELARVCSLCPSAVFKLNNNEQRRTQRFEYIHITHSNRSNDTIIR